jgi:hypothetical protein
MKRWIQALIACCCALVTLAQPASSSSQAAPSQPAMVSLGAGIYQLGDVRLDKPSSTLSFPGFVNMTNLVVEYAIVGSGGKRHESVLVTKVAPYQIHLSALLLGATNRLSNAEAGQSLSGHPITIWVAWKTGEIEMKVPLETLICKGTGGPPMSRGAWLYNGSQVLQGTFMAQKEESIVAIMEDPGALVNNPRPGREDDELWFVRHEAVPPLDTPVQITFDFSQSR